MLTNNTNVPYGAKVLLRLEQIQERNIKNKGYVNKNLYRFLYREELYVIAFNKLKGNNGALTPAVNPETLDGFSQERVANIINKLRDENFQPKLCRLKQLKKTKWQATFSRCTRS